MGSFIYYSKLISGDKYVHMYLNNNITTSPKNYCRIYSIYNALLAEDSIGLLKYDKIQIIDSSICTYQASLSLTNNIQLKYTKYNLKLDTLANSIKQTSISIANNSNLFQINNLIYDPAKKSTILQGQFLGIPNNPLIIGQELDNYFLIIDSSDNLLNSCYFNNFDSSSYSFSTTSTKIVVKDNNVFTISDVKIDDGIYKKILITKFSNSTKEISKQIDYPLGLTGNNTFTLNFLNYFDKTISIIDLKNNLILYHVYDINLQITKTWIDSLDVQSSDIRAKSVELINNELYVFGIGKSYGRNDLDLFIKKVNLASTFLNNNSNYKVRIYPNPFSDLLYIEGMEINEIEVYDVYGKFIQKTINANTIQISNLPSGIYFVHLTENNQRSIFKVVKN